MFFSFAVQLQCYSKIYAQTLALGGPYFDHTLRTRHSIFFNQIYVLVILYMLQLVEGATRVEDDILYDLFT